MDPTGQLKRDLARALAGRLFGPVIHTASKMTALAYLRSNGLPEAKAEDLDLACQGLAVPWT